MMPEVTPATSCELSQSDLPLPGRPIPDSLILADLTTFHIGGPADKVVIARTEIDLIKAVREADEDSTPVLIISGGSNMLIADEGFRGTVIVVATQGVILDESACAGAYLSVAAGETWDYLAAETIAHGWTGLEMLSGIPGLVGAAPIQNIGAYGAEAASTIARVRTFDRQSSQVTTFYPADCHFDYRTSIFKQEPGRYVILSVDFQLKHGSLSTPIRYAELARHLGVELGDQVPLAKVREAVLALRRSKGMVVDPDDHDTWSAGSFFTNPIVSPDVAAHLPVEAPQFPQEDGTIKTSAAWLIDHAGFPKGYGRGLATLSTKHVLALTNRGTATACDVLTLAKEIQEGVHLQYGIILDPEPHLIGVSF
ncbi:MAG: UDP-N-acetylmuramate dehydrogenase [Propionibacteriaceae bacterium]|jgi:UDP-N-acetylmuramate dehydrogenase|nr:UDP-N-acetylmuramate dehydrogenase [Propionibacteriaceae bacterium]